MSQWWTYRLSDFLMFSEAIYFRLFELVNREFWPLQLATLATGAAILAILFRGGVWRERLIALLLAACWAWVAWAYHARHYATINWAAQYFSLGFALQAWLLFWFGAVRNRLVFDAVGSIVRVAGVCITGFALIAQPLLGPLLGRPWQQMEIFGIAPDPTVTATLGLLLAARRIPWLLLTIPLLWCAITGATLWAMQAPQAWVMPAIGLTVVLFALYKTTASKQG